MKSIGLFFTGVGAIAALGLYGALAMAVADWVEDRFGFGGLVWMTLTVGVALGTALAFGFHP